MRTTIEYGLQYYHVGLCSTYVMASIYKNIVNDNSGYLSFDMERKVKKLSLYYDLEVYGVDDLD